MGPEKLRTSLNICSVLSGATVSTNESMKRYVTLKTSTGLIFCEAEKDLFNNIENKFFSRYNDKRLLINELKVSLGYTDRKHQYYKHVLTQNPSLDFY